MMNLMNLLEFHAGLGNLALNFIIISRLGDTKGITYRSATLSPGCTHILDLIQSAIFQFFEIQVHLEVLHFNVTPDMSLIPEPSDAL